jgi:adenylate cyclase
MEVERILSFEPEATVTLSTSPDRLPYRDPNDVEHLRDSLRKAGLAE